MKSKNKAKRSSTPWTPFQQVSAAPMSMVTLEAMASLYKMTIEEATKEAIEGSRYSEYWQNKLYFVTIVRDPAQPWIQLSVRRQDREAIHDWRHLQRIKNELLGPEYEAVELFPAESRLVDAANQYHLWASKQPDYKFPFGYRERDVSNIPILGAARQRPRGDT